MGDLNKRFHQTQFFGTEQTAEMQHFLLGVLEDANQVPLVERTADGTAITTRVLDEEVDHYITVGIRKAHLVHGIGSIVLNEERRVA